MDIGSWVEEAWVSQRCQICYEAVICPENFILKKTWKPGVSIPVPIFNTLWEIPSTLVNFGSDSPKESFLVFVLKKYSIHVNLALKSSLPIHPKLGWITGNKNMVQKLYLVL